MCNITPQLRGYDKYGSGAFLAPRGTAKHKGIDFIVLCGAEVLALAAGKVTKLGYCYSDDLSYRYVQVTDQAGNDVRYFYVQPGVAEGDKVTLGTCLGLAQDLDTRYKGITPHVHFEVLRDGSVVNPNEYLA